jgi:hypothetical protein
MSGRGALTPEIRARSKELLGYEIDKTELRLMPYIQFTMMNEQRLDPRKISGEERDVLQRWREAGHIEGGASGLAITREFWDIINDLLFMGYVSHG